MTMPMNTIRSILLLLAMSVSVPAFAQYIEGTTPLLAPVAPASALDTYASHTEEYGQGGFRSVANTTARDAIPADRMKVGMLVHCLDTGTIFRLSASSNWVDSGIKAAGDWAATNLFAVASASAARGALAIGEQTTNTTAAGWRSTLGLGEWVTNLNFGLQNDYGWIRFDTAVGDTTKIGLRFGYGATNVGLFSIDTSSGAMELTDSEGTTPTLVTTPGPGTVLNYTTLTNDVTTNPGDWRARLGLSAAATNIAGWLTTADPATARALIGVKEWTTNSVPLYPGNHSSEASLNVDDALGDAGLRLKYGANDYVISAGSSGGVKLVSGTDGDPLLVSSPSAGTILNYTTLTNDVTTNPGDWRARLGLSAAATNTAGWMTTGDPATARTLLGITAPWVATTSLPTAQRELGLYRANYWPYRAGTNISTWISALDASRLGASEFLTISSDEANELTIWQNMEDETWVKWDLYRSATPGKDYYGIWGCHIIEPIRWYQPDPLDTNITWNGSWGRIASSAMPITGVAAHNIGDEDGYVEWSIVCDGGESLYLSGFGLTTGGRGNVTIDGSTNLVNALYNDGTNAFVNFSAVGNVSIVTNIARALPAGTHTIRMAKDIVNCSAGNRKVYFDAWGITPGGATHGLPGQWKTQRVLMHPPFIQTFIAGAYTNKTLAHSNPSGVALGAFDTTNHLYICTQPVPAGNTVFDRVEMTFTTPNTNAVNLVCEYHDGANWTNLTVLDGTSGWTKDGIISFTRPPDWAAVSVNSGTSRYWMRFTVDAQCTDTTVATIKVWYWPHDYSPTKYVYSVGAHWEYAGWFTPEGSTAQNFGGVMHGGEDAQTVTIYVDGVAANVPLWGCIKGREIRIDQTADMTTGALTWGQSAMSHLFNANNATVDTQYTFLMDGLLAENSGGYMYTSMMSVESYNTHVGYCFERFKIFGDEMRHVTNCVTKTRYGLTQTGAVGYVSDAGYACAMIQDDPSEANLDWSNTALRTFVLYNAGGGTLGASNVSAKAYVTAADGRASVPITSGTRMGARVRYYVTKGGEELFP